MKNALFALFSLIMLGLAACIGAEPRPEVAEVAVVVEEATFMPTVTPSATATAAPTMTVTPQSTAMITLTPTPTAVPLPSASVLFVQEKALQQWMPQTDEVKKLATDVDGRIKHAGDIVVFMRKVAEGDKALIVYHLPTQTEVEVFHTATVPLISGLNEAVTISPNGRWLAYASAAELSEKPTLFVHEILVAGEQVSVSPPVMTLVTDSPWREYHGHFLWVSDSELSWPDKNGIWMMDLSGTLIEPATVIAASTNTYQVGPMNPADQDQEPSSFFTKFFMEEWSPNGRYLLVVEYFYEEGEFRIIERDTNRLFEVPDAYVGGLTDDVFWVNSETLLHFDAGNAIKIWNIDGDQDPALSLEKSIPLEQFWDIRYTRIVDNHLRFGSLDDAMLYELDLNSGELTQIVLAPGPIAYRELVWSPDDQYVVGLYETRVDDEWIYPTLFANVIDGVLWDVEEIFETDSCCFYWYE